MAIKENVSFVCRRQVHAKHEEKSETKSVYREYNREFLLPKGTNPELIRSSLSKVMRNEPKGRWIRVLTDEFCNRTAFWPSRRHCLPWLPAKRWSPSPSNKAMKTGACKDRWLIKSDYQVWPAMSYEVRQYTQPLVCFIVRFEGVVRKKKHSNLRRSPSALDRIGSYSAVMIQVAEIFIKASLFCFALLYWLRFRIRAIEFELIWQYDTSTVLLLRSARLKRITILKKTWTATDDTVFRLSFRQRHFLRKRLCYAKGWKRSPRNHPRSFLSRSSRNSNTFAQMNPISHQLLVALTPALDGLVSLPSYDLQVKRNVKTISSASVVLEEVLLIAQTICCCIYQLNNTATTRDASW